MKLTDSAIRNAVAEEGKRLELRDDVEPGLILRITDKGVRSWSVRYRNAAGEQRRKALGKYPTVGLARAREEARRAKGELVNGADIVAVEKAHRAQERLEKLSTISGLATAYFAAAEQGSHRGGSKAKPKRPGTIAEERRIFDKLIKPVFGDTSVKKLTRAEIRDFVAKQAKKAPSNGRHCRNIIRQLLSYALVMDLVDVNNALQIAAPASEARDRVMSDSELQAFWKACQSPQDYKELALSRVMGIALRMAAVTLQRGGEVIGMKWSEIDRQAKIWKIPVERMKGKKVHVVPLSPLAMELLDEASALQEDTKSEYVFSSPRSQEDASMDRRAFSRAMNRTMKVLEQKNATPHDLRRTGATNLTSERIGIPRFIVSLLLAHASDTGGAAAVTGMHYDMHDYLSEKRRASDSWSHLLNEIVSGQQKNSNVSFLRSAK